MAVRPFSLAALPRVRDSDVVTARRAAVRFGAEVRVLDLTVARFGRVTLTFTRPLPASRPANDESIWCLRHAGARGWLVMGHAAGLRIVAAVLGIPGPRVHRPLGTTERGVLAAALSAVVRLAPDMTLAGARPDEWLGNGLARIEVRAESETFREAFFLDVPPTWIPGPSQGAIVEHLQRAGVSITLAIEVARTTITAEEWSRAGAGDAIVFDERWDRTLAAGTMPVRVVCGGFAAPATFTEPRTLRLTGGFAPDVLERNPMSNAPDRDITTTVLAAAPIQVVAEVGRVALRADEVASLQAGSIVALPAQAQSRIELRIGDRLWARGELVDVEGQLGVRLTSIAAPLGHGDLSDADTVRR